MKNPKKESSENYERKIQKQKETPYRTKETYTYI